MTTDRYPPDTYICIGTIQLDEPACQGCRQLRLCWDNSRLAGTILIEDEREEP